jgi:hypothetical protein
MSPATACPNEDHLRDFLLGRSGEAEVRHVEEHLSACSSCLRRLESLHTADHLLVALRAPNGGTPEPPQRMASLILRLKSAGVEAVPQPPTTPLASQVETTPPEPAPPPRPAPLPSAIGRFRIIKRLGAGGMGTVYLAHDPQLDREVALKVPRLDPSSEEGELARQRFLREARAAAAVRHPHVCPIHDVGEHEGQPYVVMDFVAGSSLAERLRKQGRLDDRAAAELVRQAAEALQAVHDHGLIHRDLKPANILLDGDGKAVLTDFGLARPENDADGLTGSGVILGTPAYMAPEQADPERGPTDVRSDVYSLGVVLYQLLTGKVPFEGSPLSVIRRIADKLASPPSVHRTDLDAGLEAIVRKAMAREPAQRYQRAAEMAADLAKWLAAPTGTPRRPRRRWPLWTAGAAAVLLVAGLAVFAASGEVRQWFGVGVTRVETAHGVLEIRTDDPDVQIVVKRNGQRILIIDPKENRTVEILTGDIELELIDNGRPLALKTNHFTLTRDERKIVEVVRLPVKGPDVTDVKPTQEKPERRPPDLSKFKQVFDDDFSEPEKSVLLAPGRKPPVLFRNDKEGGEIRLQDGRLLLIQRPHGVGAYHWIGQARGVYTDFACEMTGRIESDSDALWMLYCVPPAVAKQGRGVAIRVDGGVEIGPVPWATMPQGWQPQQGPIHHPAVRPGKEWNTVLLVKRGRMMEVFINGTAVGEPIIVEEDMGACLQGAVVYLRLPGSAKAEIRRFKLWDLSQPAERRPPDLSKIKPVINDDFTGDPRTGPFHAERSVRRDQAGLEHTFGNGRQRHIFQAGHWGARYANWTQSQGSTSDFACQLVGRVESTGEAAWMVFFHRQNSDQSIGIMLRTDGALEVQYLPWFGCPPRKLIAGPIRHAAIRPANEFNTLLVTLRGRTLEVFVNGVAVTEPLTLDDDFTPAYQGIGLWLRSGGEAMSECTRFTLWELPPQPDVKP